MKERILAVIPARGGSKRLPNKNMRLLAGKPLIVHTIETAGKSEFISDIVVSTDHAGIEKVSRDHGVEVIRRPAELAADDSPTIDALIHAMGIMENRGLSLDVIVTLQPTSPLRNPEDIDGVIRKLLETNADSVVTVCEMEDHPWLAREMKNDRLVPFMEVMARPHRKQDLPVLYKINGAVYATRRDVLLEQESILGNDTRAIVMDRSRSVDIDTELDFLIAGTLLERDTTEGYN